MSTSVWSSTSRARRLAAGSGDGRGGYNNKPGQRSFANPNAPREGGYNRDAAPSPYNRDSRGAAPAPRQGGFNRDAGAPRREGGYKGTHARSTDTARRTFGD